MRTFPFPQDYKDPCPACGTKDETDTILVPISGTSDGNIHEARPIHLDCIIKGVGFFPGTKGETNSLVAMICKHETI